MKKLMTATAIALVATSGAALAGSHSTSACLITKTDTNPFFVKMREGAAAKAEELGITLMRVPKPPARTTRVRPRTGLASR